PAGPAYLDELSSLGDNTLAEFYQDNGFNSSTLAPGMFPIQQATLADLAGSDRAANGAIVRRILYGEERGPKREAVLLNAGAALFVAGHCRTWIDGWKQAEEVIESGRARRKLEELVKASGVR